MQGCPWPITVCVPVADMYATKKLKKKKTRKPIATKQVQGVSEVSNVFFLCGSLA